MAMDENKKNPLLFILVIINTVFVGFLFMKQGELSELADEVLSEQTKTISPEKQGQNHFEITPGEGNIIQEFPIDPITANLARPDGPQRFLSLTMVLVLETPQAQALDELTNKLPTFRDEIIDILNTHTPAQVLKLEGREVLKNLIKKHLNQSLKSDKVRRILFTQFKVS